MTNDSTNDSNDSNVTNNSNVTDNESTDSNSTVPVKRKPGRPRKTDLAKKKPGGRGKVGRPKGDAAIMNEYKARMLTSPQSRKVLDKVFSVALDDEHKHQAVCMKLIMDRIAPTAAFEADLKGAKKAGGIQINITGIGQGVQVDGKDTVEAEWEPVERGEDNE